MALSLRMNHFIQSANQAYRTSDPKYLIADSVGLGVSQHLLPSFFSSQAEEQNKRTWRIFRESLVGVIGEKKFDWICHRYRSKLNFIKMEASGAALLPGHVELFTIGTAQVLTRDVKAQFPNHKIKTYSREQLTEKIKRVQPFPIIGAYKDPVAIWGSPGSFLGHFFHDKVLMDKEKQLLFSDVDRLTFPAWLERFNKVVINRELIQGQLIPAPGHDGKVDYYKVYRKVATGDGLVAYALKPAASDSSLKPLIAFRPSQWAPSNEDAFETYLNDVQPNVGEMGWKAARESFQELMADSHFRPSDQKISVAGYSLGGAHAQYFLAEHADHVSYAVFYNDPSVDNETAENFAKKMNQMPRRIEPLNIQIYRMRGDVCDYVGQKHIGWGVEHPDVNIQLTKSDHENKQVAALTLHSHRIFDNTHFPYQMQCVENAQELFNELDNSKRGDEVFWYEKMRRFWGTIAFYALYFFSEFIKIFSAGLGVKILRRSSDID